MLFLCSAFSSGDVPRPLVSCLYDEETRRPEFHQLYHPEGKPSLQAAEDAKKRVEEAVRGREVVILDAKMHHDAFQLRPSGVWEAQPSLHVQPRSRSLQDIKKLLLRCIIKMRTVERCSWRRIHAAAARVYSRLQRLPMLSKGSLVQPIYHLDTASGRSRATGFPIQTTTVDLAPADPAKTVFLHLDWLSADMRAAALLSGDEEMNLSFECSDPYTKLSEMLGVSREDCKKALLQVIYSLSVEDDVLSCFPTFRDWMRTQIKAIRSGQGTTTLLGRRFAISEKHDERTIFNAAIQGSVAHAMQATLVRAFVRCPGSVFTELQDSLVLVAEEDEVEELLHHIVPAMLHPLAGLVSNNPIFPLRISIGRRWRQWRQYCEVRTDEQAELKQDPKAESAETKD